MAMLLESISSEQQSDPRWSAALAITKSTSFSKATRLCHFLLYVCEKTLAGRCDEITEQQIGVHVFGKSPAYNPSDDTIVRATARQLRQRLAVYYQEEGRNEPLKISIPKGGYIPSFSVEGELPLMEVSVQEKAQETPRTTEPDDVDAALSASPQPHSSPTRKTQLRLLAMSLSLAAIVLLTWVARYRSTPYHAMWNLLFTAKQPTLIVAGDAGLNIFENFARHEVTLDEYSSRSYMENPYAQTPEGYTWAPLATRTYAPIQDLRLAVGLCTLPEFRPRSTRVRYARELNIEDLKDANAILLGAPQYDPWEHLFDRDLNFTLKYDAVANTIAVNNRSPLRGEQRSYTWTAVGPNEIGYAVITLTNNLSGNGKVLLVQGTTVAGEDAAADFLLDEKAMNEFLGSVIDSKGKLHNFQLLLGTTMTGGDSHESHIIASRIF